MIPLRYLSPRAIVLLLLWMLPVLATIVLGFVAIYKTGWLYVVFWMMPGLWLAAWIVGILWKPAKPRHHKIDGKPIEAPEFWTPRDAAAITIVEDFRSSIGPLDFDNIVDFERYIQDGSALADRLATHYYTDSNKHLFHSLTLIEILSVIHLAVEDLEEWTLKNIPGSDVATIGQLERIPDVMSGIDTAQKIAYFVSTLFNPAKILAYPLWRKSGQARAELQNEVIRGFYQRYLRQVGFYLIEMYSGRLQGGSQRYRSEFEPFSRAVRTLANPDDAMEKLQDVTTTIAVMGQVKAGKSSLINVLMNEHVCETGIMPQTREVKRYQYSIPGSSNSVVLLDTPGYSEADVSSEQLGEIKSASEQADIILLVMAANSPARDADVNIVRALVKHYRTKQQLRPPAIIAVLTHIDLLRPVREWSPPYHWRNPTQPKEESIAAAVQYVEELLGDAIAGYACVYTGDTHGGPDTSVIEEVVPQLIDHLNHGHAAAVLKAFYQQISRERFAKLSRQVIGLLKALTK